MCSSQAEKGRSAAALPSGSVIFYMLANTGADATEAFKEFHMRSPKAWKMLRALPSRPAERTRMDHPDGPLLEDFAKWRAGLEKEGFFKPSAAHLAYRFAELAAMFAVGTWLMSMGWAVAASVVYGAFFGARCGWVQHEGGHNSLTGCIWWDKRIQAATCGFGLATSGDMWNQMHNKHHATPQKVRHDMDLDTTPTVAFFPTAVEDNRRGRVAPGPAEPHTIPVHTRRLLYLLVSYCARTHSPHPRPWPATSQLISHTTQVIPSYTSKTLTLTLSCERNECHGPDSRPRGFNRLWARYQAWTFVPVTSGILVPLFWMYFLHPRQAVRKGNAEEATWMFLSHVIRTAVIKYAGGYGWPVAGPHAHLNLCSYCTCTYLVQGRPQLGRGRAARSPDCLLIWCTGHTLHIHLLQGPASSDWLLVVHPYPFTSSRPGRNLLSPSSLPSSFTCYVSYTRGVFYRSVRK